MKYACTYTTTVNWNNFQEVEGIESLLAVVDKTDMIYTYNTCLYKTNYMRTFTEIMAVCMLWFSTIHI